MNLKNSAMAFAVAMIAAVMWIAPSRAANAFGVEVGKPAPNFTLPDMDGNWVSLDDFRGKKVLLFQWASWCSCREQLPLLETLHKELLQSGANARLLAVAIDSMKDRRTAPILKKAGVTFPNLIDQENLLGDLYNIAATQNMFLIDEAGIVKRQWLADFFFEKPEIGKAVRDFLAEPAAEWAPDEAGQEKSADEKIAFYKSKLRTEEKKNGKARRLIAQELTQKGDHAGAAEQYKILIDAKSAEAEDYFSLGSALYNLGDEAGALANWKMAQKKDPYNYIYMRSVQAMEAPDMFYTREKLGELFLEDETKALD